MQINYQRCGMVRNAFLLLAVFDSYCQMAPAAAGTSHQFELGAGYSYRLENTVLMNEGVAQGGKDVGYHITGELSVGSLWENPVNFNDKLIRLQLTSPILHIKSRKAPAPEGFIAHTSKLENMANGAFYIHWTSGKIDNIYIEKDEERSLINLKKGIASMFQFQLLDMEVTEKDASGRCQASYKTIDSHTFLKTKSNCVNGKGIPLIVHPDKVMGANVSSLRKATYQLSKDLSVLRSVMTEETHEMSIVMRQEASTSVKATQEITLTDEPVALIPVKASSVEAAILALEENSGKVLNKMILVSEREPTTCVTDECPSLHKLVKENHGFLGNEHLGTTKSANAFVKLLSTVRESSKDQILKALKSSKSKDIILQLGDLIGAAQTKESHAAAMSFIQVENENDLELCERYFWALSLGSHPNADVIKDVLKLTSQRKAVSEKLRETLLLTVSAMTNKFRKLPGNKEHKVVDEVLAFLISGLKECSDDECKQRYLRALKNLGLESTIPTLLGHALTGTRKTSVAAMKALRALPIDSWDAKVKQAAIKIFYQIGKKFDSSARTLASDILLESNPSQEDLVDLIWSLNSNDPTYEVKQYVLQRLRQISERDPVFRKRVLSVIHGETRLNNYHVLGQRGLSTAFTRTFLSGPSGNGSLVTIQEISSGLLKRGIVDIELDSHGQSTGMFSLGLFAGGLGSFISSDEPAPEDEPEEAATAGMELTVLGVQVRPFVFFNGQGELMGHVWSGAGSEKTPAFQTLALLQDHLQYVPLQTGFVAELRLIGGVSFDLSGQIQLSLWNRNAHSLVEKNAGLSIQGLAKVDTSFVRSQVEFNVATEVKLNLVSDIDFYNNIALCLQLKQPDSVVRHNVFKVERIPGSKHRLRKSKYRVLKVSGKTYALNRKNNEMCNVIFK